MKTITIANQKGGCGKSSSTVNLAAALTLSGKKVLVIDTDPLAITTLWLNCYSDKNLAVLLERFKENLEYDIHDYIQTSEEGIDVIPAKGLYTNTSHSLKAVIKNLPEPTLSYVLQPLFEEDEYDFILIDSEGTTNEMTRNTLVASDSVIIPLFPGPAEVETLGYEISEINLYKRFNRGLHIEGILITSCDPYKTTTEFRDLIKQTYSEFNVFDAVIPRNQGLKNSCAVQKSVFKYEGMNNKAAVAYMQLAKEILEGESE